MTALARPRRATTEDGRPSWTSRVIVKRRAKGRGVLFSEEVARLLACFFTAGRAAVLNHRRYCVLASETIRSMKVFSRGEL